MSNTPRNGLESAKTVSVDERHVSAPSVSTTMEIALGPQINFHERRTPGCILRVGDQHSRFLSILTRFMVYYSSFWGPEVISMLVEQQGVLTCRSSTLTVLADSGPFRGLSLTIWGSRSDFHD